MLSFDTIAATATPAGYGGISIIRISGKDAFTVADRVVRMKKGRVVDVGKNTINYGFVVDGDEVVDEVLVSKMVAPHSFTAEDVVEINCHGGPSVTGRILSVIIENGARLAEPGEFTKRAFLNGRIDLVQAEAVSDMISARTATFAKNAMNSLKGDLSERIDEIKADITRLLAQLEVTIQYPEYDENEITDAELLGIIKTVETRLDRIIRTFERGDIMKNGIKVAIIGKPNVGKSQLLNALINENKAIVTDIAGTTRDIVDEMVNISGVPVSFIDTAGIRDTENRVERIGIEKTIEMIEKSSVVLMLVDASDKLDEEDLKIIDLIPDEKNTLFVLNKKDRGVKDSVSEFFRDKNHITVSALEKDGMEEIEDFITGFINKNADDEVGDALVSNVRHKNLLEGARSDFSNAEKMIDSGFDVDLIEIDINDALYKLGEITGETTSEDIIDEIFKNFCLGK